MVNKKRINALASLAEDMNVQTHVRANEKKNKKSFDFIIITVRLIDYFLQKIFKYNISEKYIRLS